ncbi:hypothetical protein FO519_004973 [Halicephalobus sp. NKZ332]|nr:hypothetical protein FO519_004973 [Halicephalobus sp. NKZ332]
MAEFPANENKEASPNSKEPSRPPDVNEIVETDPDEAANEEIDVVGLSPERDTKPEDPEESLDFSLFSLAPPVRKAARSASAKFTSSTEVDFRIAPQPKIQKPQPEPKKKVVFKKSKPQADTAKKETFFSKYSGRLQYFKIKHKQSKLELYTMEKHAIKMVDLVEQIMDGNMEVVSEAFEHYKKAIDAYESACRTIRTTILTERKLASEVWGANSISIYDTENGKHKILEHMIEDLMCPSVAKHDSPTKDRTTKQSKKAKKRPAPETSPTRKKTKEDPSPPPTKKSSKKEEVQPPPPPQQTKPKIKIPEVPKTPMPKFELVDECIVHKNAMQAVRDSMVLMCTCKPNKDGYGCSFNCLNVHLRMECGSRCVLKDKCQNKRFQNHEHAPIKPFFTGAKGWGIRAEAPIKVGQFIMEYVGEVIDVNETAKRLKRYSKNNHRHHYMMGLRNGAVIDATTYGNYSRFVNHSCAPNAETQKWIVDKQLRIGFFAVKNIGEGEEIVFDYAFERFGKKAQECYCGAENCTGFIGGKPDEEEEDSSVENSEASEEEEDVQSDEKKPVQRAPRRKRTEAERVFLKEIAYTRKRVVRARREVRKVIKKKKHFTKDDILAIIRHSVLVNSYEERLFISDIFLTMTNEQVKQWFVEQNGVLAISNWLLDFSCGGSVKNTMRLQLQLIDFLLTLPVHYNDEIVEGKLLTLIKHRMEFQLPEEKVIAEMMKDVVNKVADDGLNDKDLLRVLERDKVSTMDILDELVKKATLLHEKWSLLGPKPEVVKEAEERAQVEEFAAAERRAQQSLESKVELISDNDDRSHRGRTPPSPCSSISHSRANSRTESSRSCSRANSRSAESRVGSRSDSRSDYDRRSPSWDRHRRRSVSRDRDYHYDRRRRSPSPYYRRDKYYRRDGYRSWGRGGGGYRRRYYDDYRPDWKRERYSRYSGGYHGLKSISPIRKPLDYRSEYRKRSPSPKDMKVEVEAPKQKSSEERTPAPELQLRNYEPVPPPQLLTRIPKPEQKGSSSDIAAAFPEFQKVVKPQIGIKTSTNLTQNPNPSSCPLSQDYSVSSAQNGYQQGYYYYQQGMYYQPPVPPPPGESNNEISNNRTVTTEEGPSPTSVVSDPIQSRPGSQEKADGMSEYQPYEKNPNWLIHFPEVSFKQQKSSKNEALTDEMRQKKEFKERVWHCLFNKFLKNWSKFSYYREQDLTQFARKMTHLTLNSEIKAGNTRLEITEHVYARARKITEDNLGEFVRHTRPLRPLPTDHQKEIEIVFLDSLPKDLQCRQCDQVLRLPQKIPECGHRVCENCIKGLKSCPDCGKDIDHGKVKLDKEAQRRIQKLAVQCTFHDNGCSWRGELRSLEAHALNCEFSDIICPRGCGSVFPRNQQENHLSNDCSKKLVPCDYCKKDITVKGLKTHLKVCPSFKVDCPNNCGFKNRPRSEVDEHLSECPKAGSVCPFGEFGCNYTGGRENLQKHIKEQPVKHLSFLRDGVLDFKFLLSTVQLNSEKLTRNIELLSVKVNTLEKLYGAQFIWRIENVKQKQQEARSGNQKVIFSAPFFSGRHGYKLILSASLFGDGPVRGKFMSVFISIMKGDFDSLLPWPFVHKVTFTLMDQNPDLEKRNHVGYVVKPNASIENKAFLDRPNSDRNASFGAQKFCDLIAVKNYVRDDVMFIKCNVDTQNMIIL